LAGQASHDARWSSPLFGPGDQYRVDVAGSVPPKDESVRFGVGRSYGAAGAPACDPTTSRHGLDDPTEGLLFAGFHHLNVVTVADKGRLQGRRPRTWSLVGTERTFTRSRGSRGAGDFRVWSGPPPLSLGSGIPHATHRGIGEQRAHGTMERGSIKRCFQTRPTDRDGRGELMPSSSVAGCRVSAATLKPFRGSTVHPPHICQPRQRSAATMTWAKTWAKQANRGTADDTRPFRQSAFAARQ
jgi:hypothetical protein